MSVYKDGVEITLNKELINKNDAIEMVNDGLEKIMKSNQLYDIEVKLIEKRMSKEAISEPLKELIEKEVNKVSFPNQKDTKNIPPEYLETERETAEEWLKFAEEKKDDK